MQTQAEIRTQGNPYAVRDEWFFRDERGREHGPYSSLGRATIGLGRYIRDELEQDAPRTLIYVALIGVILFAGYLITHPI